MSCAKFVKIGGLTVFAIACICIVSVVFISSSDGSSLLTRKLRSVRFNETENLQQDDGRKGSKGSSAWSFSSCPPPPVTRSLEICHATRCQSKNDCPPGKSCCFNGCVRTCIEDLQKPVAFDWIEDTSKIHPILGPDFRREDPNFFQPIAIPKEEPKFLAAQSGGESVVLSGGCIISAQKYEELKLFMNAPSIDHCKCQGPEVICQVKTKKL